MTNFKRRFLDILNSSDLFMKYFLIISALAFQNTFSAFLYFMMLLKTRLLWIPKEITKDTELGKRPEGAFNCNTFSCGGKPNYGGLISGHMTNIVMVITLGILNLQDIDYLNVKNMTLFFFIICSTAVSRYMVKCHTLFQISLGIISGIVLGYISYLIVNQLKYFQRFEDDHEKMMNILKAIN